MEPKNVTPQDNSFFGQPAGLQTLFFTEMWERMSYYGMRALLVLFMTAAVQEGGLAITVATATAIYGLYTGAVYFMGLPGGWIADRLIGGQRATWYGGIIIMCGHIVLAVPSETTFFLGLILVVLGTGMLKPNISALVGQLYDDGDDRRDAGYTLYYMGINIGSLIGYLVTGYLMENVGWHWAFGAAAVGMLFGLIQYRVTLPKLGDVGAEAPKPLSASGRRLSWGVIIAFLAGLGVVFVGATTGAIVIDPIAIAQYVATAATIVFFVYYLSIFIFGKLTRNEAKRLGALFLVCIASILFWAGFEQAGSSLNLFARDLTDRMVGSFEIPTTWFQMLNSGFLIALSPFFAALWVNLTKRMINPSYGFKSAVGLIIMTSGFIVMFFASQVAASGMKVSPNWLVAVYFLHTVGELCLSPVALSAVSKLSPRRMAGQMMGIFVLTYSIGSLMAGLIAGRLDPENVSAMPDTFIKMTMLGMGVGVVIFIIALKTRKWEALAGQPDPEAVAINANEPPKSEKF
ncbi:amino acid transporter [Pseudidiomarina atlantica]|jgi:POT family proton-dependent oligopeptide transporter|uniref:Amino acid transporter n=1 Tax=Pseudidiomarina atlantica TaxID=1517416 RepID=A0A094J6U4_9GAMM|nr:peptide MFS transporter [Pseudidiomarina atlantica]KFZ28306.1 amino acid transporter [Pseudidiomarina atlantica]